LEIRFLAVIHSGLRFWKRGERSVQDFDMVLSSIMLDFAVPAFWTGLVRRLVCDESPDNPLIHTRRWRVYLEGSGKRLRVDVCMYKVAKNDEAF